MDFGKSSTSRHLQGMAKLYPHVATPTLGNASEIEHSIEFEKWNSNKLYRLKLKGWTKKIRLRFDKI